MKKVMISWTGLPRAAGLPRNPCLPVESGIREVRIQGEEFPGMNCSPIVLPYPRDQASRGGYGIFGYGRASFCGTGAENITRHGPWNLRAGA